MTTRILDLVAVAPPASVGSDDNKRAVLTFGIELSAADTAKELVECVCKIVSDNGLGVLGTDSFIGPHARIPDGNGPYTTFTPVGGYSTKQTHNSDRYPRMAIQVTTRATSYKVASDRAHDIFNLLDGMHDVTVTP